MIHVLITILLQKIRCFYFENVSYDIQNCEIIERLREHYMAVSSMRIQNFRTKTKLIYIYIYTGYFFSNAESLTSRKCVVVNSLYCLADLNGCEQVSK